MGAFTDHGLSETERRAFSELAADTGSSVSFAVPLATLTTWRIGGPADALFTAADADAAVDAVTLCHQSGWPLRVLGNGSNLLAPDAGVRGLVLRFGREANRNEGRQSGLIIDEEDRRLGATLIWDTMPMRVPAGFFLPRLAREAAGRDCGGLTCVSGVPGTLGGGIALNAGVPGSTLGEVVVDAEVLTADGYRQTWTRDQLAFGHRTSRVLRERAIVLSARLQLTDRPREELDQDLYEHLSYRRRTQPLSEATAGSVFRRPAPEVPPGRLLEEAGCKGLRIGDAQVSQLHANWIINRGHATADDVRRLMDRMAKRVRRHSGVRLEPEVTVW